MGEAEEERAIEVAELHYASIIRGEEEAWISTLKSDLRRVGDVKRGPLYFWWRAGRKMAEKGVTYRLQRIGYIQGRRAKLFFQRVTEDGRKLGLPVPIYLVKEGDEWKVDQPTY